MADPSFVDLISNPDSEDSALTWALTTLNSIGFPTLFWQSDTVGYALLRLVARIYATCTLTVRDIAKGGQLGLSTGGWLTLLLHWFALERYLAQTAVGTIALSVAPGMGPYTIEVGQIWVKEATRGLRYNSQDAVTLPAGGALGSLTNVTFQAEGPGAAYNVPLSTGLTLVTPLPGVTAAFVDATESSGTWLTTQGTDDEKDDTATARAQTRWATIGLQRPADAYLFLARNVPGVGTSPTKVKVDDQNPRGPGTLNVWFAGPAGPLSIPDRNLVRAFLLALASPCCDLQADNAPTLTVTITAIVHVFGGFPDAINQAIQALVALVDSINIGGTLQLSDVVRAIVDIDGVDKVEFAAPDANRVLLNGVAADLTPAVNQLLVPGTMTLSPVYV